MIDCDGRHLTVVIPTRNRWSVLAETLAGLAGQTVTGFEVVVVVDGEDQRVPALAADRVLVQAKAGPGAARNRAVAATDRPLLLFLGDDIVPEPTLVEEHLAVHRSGPGPGIAALGHTGWHPTVAAGQHNRWLEWSANQFDYSGIEGDDAGWGRFYSSNVSLKRELFQAAGGFDEAFTFDYEDLDLAYRLHQCGMTLVYARRARAHHLHSYDWPALLQRYRSRGQAERQMAHKHPWFEPWFRARIEVALSRDPVSPVWARLAAKIPAQPEPVRRRLRYRADTWYYQHLAPPFLGGWHGQDDVAELGEYLGPSFQPDRLLRHRELVDEEHDRYPDDVAFYRNSEAYLYDLTMFASWGTKEPYLAALRRLVPAGASVLDYGCGIGSDGLRLAAAGYRMAFADFDNPSTRYLKWRLERRQAQAEVYNVDEFVPGGFDAAYSFDVIEHVDDPMEFLSQLESRASVVMVNLLEEDPSDTHLHRPLPVRRILARAARRGVLFYQRFEGRSHLVAYRSESRRLVPPARSLGAVASGAVRSAAERIAGLPA